MGTAEILGRIIFNNKIKLSENTGFNVLIEFESIVAIAMEDRVIRSYSPVETIASGLIIDPSPSLKNKQIKVFLNDIPKKIEDRFFFY